MASKNFFSGIYRNILDSKSKTSILHNIYLLYVVFAIAVVDLFYMLTASNWLKIAIFFTVGLLVSFFSKNMIVILIIAMVVSFIFSNGAKSLEGFTEKEKKNSEEGDDETVVDETMVDETMVDEGMESMDDETMEKMKEKLEEETIESMKEKLEEEEEGMDEGMDEEIIETMEQENTMNDENTIKEEPEVKPFESHESSTGKKMNIPGITPFEILDKAEVNSKIEELMERQNVLIEKMNQHKPVLESIANIGKSLGIVK